MTDQKRHTPTRTKKTKTTTKKRNQKKQYITLFKPIL